MKFPRYKIVSGPGGRGMGSKLIDLEDGKEIAQITKIMLTAEANDLWRATVTLIGVEVEVEVESRDEITFIPDPDGGLLPSLHS
jgi:hypothetical protein